MKKLIVACFFLAFIFIVCFLALFVADRRNTIQITVNNTASSTIDSFVVVNRAGEKQIDLQGITKNMSTSEQLKIADNEQLRFYSVQGLNKIDGILFDVEKHKETPHVTLTIAENNRFLLNYSAAF